MKKNAQGVHICEHCSKPFDDKQQVYGYVNPHNKEELYFCHGVCAGAWLSGSFTRYEIKPDMVKCYTYTRPASTILKYELRIWIHPKNGGDDYDVVATTRLPIETKNPDEVVKAEIAKILKKKRSVILDDYTYKRV